MSSFWNKNITSFTNRFPSLAKNFNLNEINENQLNNFEILISKSQDLTAKLEGLLLHSAYNPLKESLTTVTSAKNENIWGAAFFSMGLGYTPLLWAKKYPDDTIIIIESDPCIFFESFKYVDFTDLFNHQKLIILLEASTQDIITLIENYGGFNHTAIIQNKNQTSHNAQYFQSLTALIERNKQKVKINNATLEKFSTLWLKNSCKNIKSFASFDGINIYKGKCPPQLPALIVSAGPTLSDILPNLKELKKRCLIIAVDTALRACINAGVEPDFIVLVDPQYYAFRHIAGLKSPSSVLITESAAYPSSYRFNCRKKVLCSSLFPLGQYFEKQIGEKGKLGAGGSVSTSAWDFARIIGAKKIYCAGLDLGYPKLQSHIRGSLFEELSHRTSNKLNPAEKNLSISLFTSNSSTAYDYSGGKIFTDEKMKMFAWWFESQSQKYPDVKSYSLSKKSYAIPGFEYCPEEALLKLPENTELKSQFFFAEQENNDKTKDNSLIRFNKAFNSLITGFTELYALAKKGFKIADTMLTNFNTANISKGIKELEDIDDKILHSQFTHSASLVFPTENKLNQIFNKIDFPEDTAKTVFIKSKIIYSELQKSIAEYQKYLSQI